MMTEPKLIFRINDNGQGISYLRQVYLERGWDEFDAKLHSCTDWNMWWRSTRFRNSDYDGINPWQRVNHFPKSSGITRKDSLARNLRRMRAVHGHSVYNFSPTSFNLPNDYTRFVSEYARLRQVEDLHTLLWICKPAELSRGRGIFIFRELSECQYDYNAVVQRYIANPFLISGYKFDLRIYVVVPCYNPLTIYLNNEGLVRFSTAKFNLDSLANLYSHLTNTSLNKNSPAYLDHKDKIGYGCKWTLTALFNYLKTSNVDVSSLWPKIVNIIILTIIVQIPQVETSLNCFELYGFDILIDDNLKAWLLEVNFSPSLTIDSDIDISVETSLNCFELYGFDILIDDNLKAWLLEVNFSPSLTIDSDIDISVKKPLLNDIIDLMQFKPGDVYRGVNYDLSKTKHASSQQIRRMQSNVQSKQYKDSDKGCYFYVSDCEEKQEEPHTLREIDQSQQDIDDRNDIRTFPHRNFTSCKSRVVNKNVVLDMSDLHHVDPIKPSKSDTTLTSSRMNDEWNDIYECTSIECDLNDSLNNDPLNNESYNNKSSGACQCQGVKTCVGDKSPKRNEKGKIPKDSRKFKSEFSPNVSSVSSTTCNGKCCGVKSRTCVGDIVATHEDNSKDSRKPKDNCATMPTRTNVSSADCAPDLSCYFDCSDFEQVLVPHYIQRQINVLETKVSVEQSQSSIDEDDELTNAVENSRNKSRKHSSTLRPIKTSQSEFGPRFRLKGSENSYQNYLRRNSLGLPSQKCHKVKSTGEASYHAPSMVGGLELIYPFNDVTKSIGQVDVPTIIRETQKLLRTSLNKKPSSK